MSQEPFYSKQWLMFPPGHDNLDHRVNRSIQAILSAGHDLTVYYESDRLVGTEGNHTFAHGAKVARMPSISRSYFWEIIKEIRRNKTEHNRLTIYVHDSGFIGLIICFLATILKRRGDRIIFDYHDLLEWELHYQSSKFVKSDWARRVLVAMARYIFKWFMRFFIRLDRIIGISMGQIDLLEGRFGIQAAELLAAPNTRIKLSGSFERAGQPAILWVGNVSKGRRFDWAYELQDALKKQNSGDKTKIIVVGKRLNKAADDIIDNERVIELGGFKNDTDIARLCIPWKSVGVFFGWDDHNKTKINEISSVNKIYSYINTVTPFLIPSSQINMIESLSIPPKFVFETIEDMAEKFNWIAENYEYAQQTVANIKKTAPWDADVTAMLKKEFSR